jgi:hypothetical protein
MRFALLKMNERWHRRDATADPNDVGMIDGPQFDT